MEEALQHRTYQDALAGKRPAMREVLRWIKKREAWLAEHMPKASQHDSVLRFTSDPDNADTAVLLLRIAAQNPIARNGAKIGRSFFLSHGRSRLHCAEDEAAYRLTDSERDAIRHCTRDPHSLLWPRGTDE